MQAGKEFQRSSYDAMVGAEAESGEIIARSLVELRSRVLLDAGCGPGVVANAAARLGVPRVVGLDVHTWAREYLDPCVEFVRHDLTAGPSAALPKADLVACFEVLEHIPEKGTKAACAALADALVPGGTLVFRAAPPGQPGCGHVSCKLPPHWIGVFKRLGLVVKDKLRARLHAEWEAAGAVYYYWQKLLVLGRPDGT